VRFEGQEEIVSFTDNKLIKEHDIFPEVNVTAQDFSVMNLSGVLGYNVGFKLENATAKDVRSIQASIYSGETCLQTNTAIMEDFKDEYPNAEQLSSPFDVFGGFNYQRFWRTEGWNKGVSELTVPDKAEIIVTFENGVTATATNTTLTGDVSKIIPDKLISLTWDEDSFEKDSDGAYVVNVDETGSFDISVTAESDYMIDKVLFVIEVTGDNDFTAVAVDGQSLGYDEEGGFWYWGPRNGFTFERGSTTSEFTVTAEPGTYSVRIYTVQLD